MVPVSTRKVLSDEPSASRRHVIRLAKQEKRVRTVAILNNQTMSNSVISVISRFLEEYSTSTPTKLKVVDAYLLYILLTGALQFLYCLLVGTFPFNSFLSGFISCVGAFILAGKCTNCTVCSSEVRVRGACTSWLTRL